MCKSPIGLGVLGCGEFARFSLSAIRDLGEIELVGIGATYPDAADCATDMFGVPDFGDASELVTHPNVEIVYIATPPFLHHEQAMLALEAGKHVICEKPLALTPPQGREMIQVAEERDLLLAVNLMQRYNPLYEHVRSVIEEELLGKPLHGYFENYATDEYLPSDHWFWDREKSGGIFIEHGVHFFDLFRGWLGPGTVCSAQRGYRPDGETEDRVQCAVRYAGDVMVNYYHGFHHPERIEKQELRLVFERGEVTLDGWIPVRATFRGLADESTFRRLKALLPHPSVKIFEDYDEQSAECRGRGKTIRAHKLCRVRGGGETDKDKRHAEIIRALFQDQIDWIKDRNHSRTITAENAMNSLTAACRADELAHQAPDQGR
ncbi:MAG: Gfo/Idh/MocA family protein [Planctomycetota bacterium]